MTLAEFDKVRPYLPDDTEIELKSVSPAGPGSDEVWAVSICSWGNHDGRFNVMCAACGDIVGHDIPAALKSQMRDTYEHKACPKCGRKFIKKKELKHA